MILKKDKAPKTTLWDPLVIDDFMKLNQDKKIAELIWSVDSNKITDQLQFAMSECVDVLISEVLPDELPNTITNNELIFLCEKLHFFGPRVLDFKVRRKETDNDKTLFLINEDDLQSILKKRRGLEKLFDIVKSIDKNEFYYVSYDNVDTEQIIDRISTYKRVVCISLNPQFVHFIVNIPGVIDDKFIKFPFFDSECSRFLFSNYTFNKNINHNNKSLRVLYNSLFNNTSDIALKSVENNNHETISEYKRVRLIESLHKDIPDLSHWGRNVDINIGKSEHKFSYKRSYKKFIYSYLNADCPDFITHDYWTSSKTPIISNLLQRLICSAKTYQVDQEFRHIFNNYFKKLNYSELTINLLKQYIDQDPINTLYCLELLLSVKDKSDFEIFSKLTKEFLSNLNSNTVNNYKFFHKLLSVDAKTLKSDIDVHDSLSNIIHLNDNRFFTRFLPVVFTPDEVIEIINGINLSDALKNTIINGFFYANGISEPDFYYGAFLDSKTRINTKKDLLKIITELDIRTHISAIVKTYHGDTNHEILEYSFPNNYSKIKLILQLLKKNEFDLALKVFNLINLDHLNDYEYVILCCMQQHFENKFNIFKFSIQDKIIDIAAVNRNKKSNFPGIFTYLHKFFESIDNNKSDTYKRIAESSEYNHLSILKYWNH